MTRNTDRVGAANAPRQAAHTPEPWLLSRTSNGYSIYARGSAIALVEPDDEQTRANAERIASCVNALEGISNPAAMASIIGDIKEAAQYAKDKDQDFLFNLILSWNAALDSPVPKKEEIS